MEPIMTTKRRAASRPRRTERVEPDLDAFVAGTRAARELQEALRGAGFVFPSLRGDCPVADQGHVKLGGLSAGEALRFAAWLRGRTA
jgi:hypothetical protein